jgi:hypothetical protein
LNNNAYIDSLSCRKTNLAGTPVAKERFNQRYFECTLNWDFENTWVWSKKDNQPDLLAGITSWHPTSTIEETAPEDEEKLTVDLLTQQVTANIWL